MTTHNAIYNALSQFGSTKVFNEVEKFKTYYTSNELLKES
jgi:hypothetical protein